MLESVYRSLLIVTNENWQKQIEGAANCGYKHLIFGPAFIDIVAEVFAFASSQQVEAHLFLNANQWPQAVLKEIDSRRLIFFADARQLRDLSHCLTLQPEEILLCPHPRQSLVAVIASLPISLRQQVRFNFQNPLVATQWRLWRPRQIIHQSNQVLRLWPDMTLRTSKYSCLQSSAPAQDHRLNLQTLFEHKTVQPFVSVIIASFNRKFQLLETLRALEQQNFDKQNFEVIVVDDGSHDNSAAVTIAYLRKSNLQTRYLYRPRTRASRRAFSAAGARNIGAHLARGEVLAFLDADIEVASTYLQEINDRVSELTVLMGARQEASAKPDHYWQHFYEQHQPWMEQVRPWRFVSTHSLSLRKRFFENMGGFRENFAHYGYEDIDLGYRLYCAGAIFDLCQSSVIHQNDISNFAKRYLLRFKNRMALSRSARVFFEGNLQNDVYLHCRYLFRPFLAFWFLAEDIYHLFSPRRRA